MIKRNKLPSHGKTRRKLKCILPSRRRQSGNATYYIIMTILHCGKSRTMETVRRFMVSRNWMARDENCGALKIFRAVKIFCVIL